MKKSSFVYPHFETFANSSDKKYHKEKSVSPPKLSRLPDPKPRQTFLSSSFRIEDLLDDLIDSTEMDLFITADQLRDFLKSYEEG